MTTSIATPPTADQGRPGAQRLQQEEDAARTVNQAVGGPSDGRGRERGDPQHRAGDVDRIGRSGGMLAGAARGAGPASPAAT